MKMKCLVKSMLRGDIVKSGEILDLTDAECELDVVKHYFVKVDDNPAPTKGAEVAVPAAVSGKVLVAGLTRDQALMKLNQAGVKVKGNASNKDITDLYNLTFANMAEVTAK